MKLTQQDGGRLSPILGKRSYYIGLSDLRVFQPAFTCSKLTVETLEQGVKYVQS